MNKGFTSMTETAKQYKIIIYKNNYNNVEKQTNNNISFMLSTSMTEEHELTTADYLYKMFVKNTESKTN